jgi:hypothetical protein
MLSWLLAPGRCPRLTCDCAFSAKALPAVRRAVFKGEARFPVLRFTVSDYFPAPMPTRLRQPAFVPQSRDYGASRGYGVVEVEF